MFDNHCSSVLLTSVIAGLICTSVVYGQTCPPFWQDADGGLSSSRWPATIVFSFASYDPDGPNGPAESQLFVGGVFNAAGDVIANNIARWNGFGWLGVGNIQPESSLGEAYELLAGPDLSDPDHAPVLYLAAIMSAIDSVPVDLVAKWDGRSWSSLGPLEGRVIFGMTMHDSDGSEGPLSPILVAVGQRRTEVGGPANPVAFWDGVEWTTPVQPVNKAIWDAVSFDVDGDGPEPPALFVTSDARDETWEYVDSAWVHRPGAGGKEFLVFDPDGDGPERAMLVVAGNGVVRLNPDRSWSLVGDALEAEYLTSWDPDGNGPLQPLLVAGGKEAVMAWDGASWTDLGAAGLVNGFSGNIFAVHSFDDDGLGPRAPMLFVGGEFFTIDDLETEGVAIFGCNPPLSPCIGDANGDQRVNFADITTIIANWGESGTMADTDQDGIVGMRDITSVLSSWGADCSVESPPATSTTATLPTSDVNGDGVINFADITASLSGMTSSDN